MIERRRRPERTPPEQEPVRRGRARRHGGAQPRPTATRTDAAATFIARALSLLALLGLLIVAAPAARADGYRLGPQDGLRIKLVEWRPGNGEAVEWEAISDTYVVGADGKVSLPMLGVFAADGRTTSDLADAIGAEMQKLAGLPTRPQVSVEVQTYRSIYVLGSVETPGGYPFRPEMTPLQAVGIAGGFYRPTDAGLLRIERDRITAQGLRQEYRLALQRGLVRAARLEAELADRTQITLPRELDAKDVSDLVADEEALARSRATAFNAQIKSAESLKALLGEQIKTLDGKIASQDKQIDISRRELQSYSALQAQGLAITSRSFSIERLVAEAEGRKIDYEMSALNARQDYRKAEQSLTDLRNERRTKMLADLGDARIEVARQRSRVAAQDGLIREATVTVPSLVLDRERSAQDPQATFILTRRAPGSETASTTVVPDTTTLEPGDVLRVEMPSPAERAREAGDRGTRSSDRRSAAE